MGNIAGMATAAYNTATTALADVAGAAKNLGKAVVENCGGGLLNHKLEVGAGGALLLAAGAPITGATALLVGATGVALKVGLPNNPDFDQAIANPQALHQQYQNTLANNYNGAPQQPDAAVTSALQQLDTAFALSNQQTRGGANLQNFNANEFHAALLMGAHFVVPDGGALLNALTTQGPGAQPSAASFNARTSSHYNGQNQFGMDLPNGMGHLLVGTTANGDTFFQLESHGLGNPNQGTMETLSEVFGHTVSYLQHIGTSDDYVQIGPQGCIAGSEKDNNHVVLN